MLILPKFQSRVKEMLELTHTSFCALFSTPSFFRSKDFVTNIDILIGIFICIFYKKKINILSTFKIFENDPRGDGLVV